MSRHPIGRPFVLLAVLATATSLAAHEQSRNEGIAATEDAGIATPLSTAQTEETVAKEPIAANPTISLELQDPAFDRYVDATLVTKAVNSMDPDVLVDAALQLAEGERVLLRPHKAASVDEILDLAIRVAAEDRNEAALARIERVTNHLEKTKLAAKLEMAKQAAGESRAVDPAARISVMDTDPHAFLVFHEYVHALRRARLMKDGEMLRRLEEDAQSEYGLMKQLSEKQREYLNRIMGESRAIVEKADEKTSESLLKLAEKSREEALQKVGAGSIGATDSNVTSTGTTIADDEAFSTKSQEPIHLTNALHPSEAVIPGTISELPTDLRDPGFEKYVDLRLLCEARASMNPVLWADIAMQLADGERILLRPHNAICADDVFLIAIRVAALKRDKGTLERLGKAVASRDNAELRAALAAAQQLVAESRAEGSIAMVSVESVTPLELEVLQTYMRELQWAQVTHDAKGHSCLEAKVRSDTLLSESQREQMIRVLEETRGTDQLTTKRDSVLETLEQLNASSRQLPYGPCSKCLGKGRYFSGLNWKKCGQCDGSGVVYIGRVTDEMTSSKLSDGTSGQQTTARINVGEVYVYNNYDGSVTICLYHPAAPSRQFGRWEFGPRRRSRLLRDGQVFSVGEDWQIEILFGNGVRSPRRSLTQVSSYSNGRFYVDATVIFGGR